MQTTFPTAGLFAAIDARDAAAFGRFLHEDAVFQFGNAPAVRGRVAISEMVAGFFASISGVQHELAEVWQPPGTLICHGTVRYTRHDASTLAVPFANILLLEGELAREYRIFTDISAL